MKSCSENFITSSLLLYSSLTLISGFNCLIHKAFRVNRCGSHKEFPYPSPHPSHCKVASIYIQDPSFYIVYPPWTYIVDVGQWLRHSKPYNFNKLICICTILLLRAFSISCFNEGVTFFQFAKFEYDLHRNVCLFYVTRICFWRFTSVFYKKNFF